jgi:uncharacterized membrane protein
MGAYLATWAELLLRWFHVVAGIAWIGESFYFVMLDRSLTAPRLPALGVAGEMWSVHGGGFYHAQKYTVAPSNFPEHLHWSQWKSYATWLSGAALFTALYLAQPDLYLVDPAVRPLSPAAADALAVVFLLAGWLVYDALCRALSRDERALGVAAGAMVAGFAFAATHLFSGRAAFLITGAMLATIMSANVLFVIIPGQRAMVASMEKGEAPDPLPGVLGRQRSVHNTYFTLPVVFAMISNHYAMTYSAPHAWAVLCVIMLAGALTRQFFVLWHGGMRAWWLPAAGAACVAGVIAWLLPAAPSSVAASATPVTLAGVAPIIAARCAPCHAAHPTLMPSAPAGLMLDSSARILVNASAIYQQAVQLRAMPLGNLTHITDDERARIARWVTEGAHP